MLNLEVPTLLICFGEVNEVGRSIFQARKFLARMFVEILSPAMMILARCFVPLNMRSRKINKHQLSPKTINNVTDGHTRAKLELFVSSSVLYKTMFDTLLRIVNLRDCSRAG